jgi:hypothetical protein
MPVESRNYIVTVDEIVFVFEFCVSNKIDSKLTTYSSGSNGGCLQMEPIIGAVPPDPFSMGDG